MNYITNSKNRKLKTRILHLTSRLQFGLSHIDLLDKYCVLSIGALIVSLFLPWIQLFFVDNRNSTYSVLSAYAGISIYLILFIVLTTLFLLFSHTKKEKARSVYFLGAMDGQIYMFFGILLMVVLLDVKYISSLVFEQFASGAPARVLSGYILAFIGAVSLSIVGYLRVMKERKDITRLAYIDRSESSEMSDYDEILQSHNQKYSSHSPKDSDKKKNMSLPI